jgi:hypothetical protein
MVSFVIGSAFGIITMGLVALWREMERERKEDSVTRINLRDMR